jgi:hypothetical protein
VKNSVKSKTDAFNFLRGSSLLRSVAMATDLGQMAKYVAFGHTLASVTRERERQSALRESQPGAALARILERGHGHNDSPEVLEQMRIAAVRKAFPNRQVREPQTEKEKLLAWMPKSSAQVIGRHDVPDVAIPPPRPRNPEMDQELVRMQQIFPLKASGEVGFHHDFGTAKTQDAREAQMLIDALKPQQVARDPQLAAALAKLQAVVETKARYKNATGAPRGVQQRR